MSKVFKENDNVVLIENDGVTLVQFKSFMKHESKLSHCITTRLGGVSTGECHSLNMGFNRNDARENVHENYRRVALALDISIENMVFSNQVHDNKVKPVDESDRGKGILRISDIAGYDGLVTNKKDVALVTFYADCVPVLFFDPVKRVIAASHSGWRGTVKEIAVETIKKMVNEYDCRVDDIETAIGPSIGQCCFEVGEEVYGEFVERLPWSSEFIKECNDKWYIDLRSVIKQTLLNTGVREKNISNSELCTKCNKDIFFSHRGDNGKTGSLAAIIQLR